MGKESNILTIDIGSRSIKMAEFCVQGGTLLLTKFLNRRIEKLQDESVAACFERNYNEMLAEGGFTANSVRLALPSSNSFQRLSKLPPMLGKSDTVSKIIEFEAAQAVPYAMHEVEWGYQLLHHEWEETSEEKDDDGSVKEVKVKNEEYEALFLAVKNEDVVCYTDAIERSGKKLISVELSALCLFNAAVVSQVNENECVMILEIGGRGSCLMIADHRRIFMRNIPIGGDAVNIQISKEFGVGDEEAEEMKRRYGFVALGGAYDEPESTLASTISKIARNVMTRLHGEISRSVNVWRAQHNGNAPTKVLLAGGGSTMQYSVEFFNEKFRLPVEYLNAFGLITIGGTIDRGQLTAAASMSQAMIGMALHAIGSCPVDISLLPRAIKQQYILDARKPYFYASAVALISCLLISWVGIRQVRNFEKERVEKIEAEVKIGEAEVTAINGVNGQLQTFIGDFNQAAKYLDARNQIGNLMNKVQSVLPQGKMWLISFEPYVESEEGDGYSSGGESAASAAAQKREQVNPLDPAYQLKYSNITEVTKLRLAGYVLTTKGKDGSLVLSEFEDRIKAEEDVFAGIEFLQNRPHGDSNLYYFEVILTLKDALKK